MLVNAFPYHLLVRIFGSDFKRHGLPLRTAALLPALVFVLLSAAAPATAADPSPAAADATTVAGATIDSPGYWTGERMLAARPAQPPTPPEGAFDPDGALIRDDSASAVSAADGDFFPTGVESFPQRVHGKIFFRVDGQDFECSGTVVDSKGRNIVFTAGHCVFDRETGAYAEQLAFVPAFQDGDAPLGIWQATAVFTTSRYVDTGDLSHDIGVAVLDDPVQSELGSRKIAFDLDPEDRSFTIYGYPGEPDPPYDGGSLAGCRSATAGRDPVQGNPAPIAAGPCRMGSGSSGGGWITGGGLLNSVVSYTYCDNVPDLCGFIFGPYFSRQALDLYTFPAVGGSAAPKVRIASSPPRRIKRKWARFRFSGSGSTPVSFRCRLDGRSPFKCGRKAVLKRLGKGRHVLRVNSVDQTGRVSPQGARKVFRVVKRRR